MKGKRRVVILVAVGSSAPVSPSEAPSSRQPHPVRGGDCKMGFSTSDVPSVQGSPVSQVVLNKTCAGPVEARFTSEITRLTDGVSARGGVFMTATCAGCHFYRPANPLWAYLSECVVSSTELCPSGPLGTRGMNMIWPSLPSGEHRFEVWDNSGGVLQYGRRTLTIEAFTAG